MQKDFSIPPVTAALSHTTDVVAQESSDRIRILTSLASDEPDLPDVGQFGNQALGVLEGVESGKWPERLVSSWMNAMTFQKSVRICTPKQVGSSLVRKGPVKT